MERRPPWWWATPGLLAAPWLLGLLMCAWTLRLTGTPSSFCSCALWLAHIRAASICRPLIPPGPCLRGFAGVCESCRLHRGSLQGPRGCLANTSPRCLLKGQGQPTPLTAVLTASLLAQPDLLVLKQSGWASLGQGVSGRCGGQWGGSAHPKKSYGGTTALNLPGSRASLACVCQGGEGRLEAGHQEHCAPRLKVVTVARRGGTSHFLKCNQRPRHYFTTGARPFWGPVPCPFSWS